MRRTCAILAFLFPLVPLFATAQEISTDLERARRDKIESILRLQDLRSPNDGELRSLFGDPDAVVRARAHRACSSTQDTTLLEFLLRGIDDPDATVRREAAFALGQTAFTLSPAGRLRVEQDLVAYRLTALADPAPLLEAFGTFCTADGLDAVLLRFGTTHPSPWSTPLHWCLARAAIRGVSTETGVRFLLRAAQPPEGIPWIVMYAFQRIGNHPLLDPEVSTLVQAGRSPDPLARMHLATLLGKLRVSAPGRETLERMAEFDADWRVRVQALRALAAGGYLDFPEMPGLLRRALLVDSDHIRICALIAAARLPTAKGADLEDLLAFIERIARNAEGGFSPPVQAEAARTFADMRGPAALGVLRSVPAGIPVLNVAIVDAVARTGAREGVADLLPLLQGKEPALVCSAIQGVSTLARRYANDRTLVADVRRAILGTLALDDLAVSATAAETLADSLFRDREVVTALLATLGRLHLPNDIEAMQSVASALGKMGDTRALAPLQSLQRLPDRSVALAATEALRTLTGGDVALPPPPARPLLTSFDFAYLVGLPDTVHLSIETIRGTMQVDLYPLLAPFTVMNFLKLASERGFFRGRTFHRVVPNFVVQGGDPRGDGWGGPGYTIRSEFSPAGFEEGSVGMASAGKDTEGSQFFITQSPQPHLDGRYTVFGKLVAGTEVLDAIQIGDRILDVQWRR